MNTFIVDVTDCVSVLVRTLIVLPSVFL